MVRAACVLCALVLAGCSGAAPEPRDASPATSAPVVVEGTLWDWLRRVVEAGGYRVVDRTAAALVAEGDGASFYVWATDAPSPETAAAERWTRRKTIDGVHVYGDDDLWRWWRVQDLVVWIQAGPRATSRPPEYAELGRLVRASRSMPLFR